MFLEAGVFCLSHGLTSFIVHGIPAFRLAQDRLITKDILLSKSKFTFVWICFYTILTPISFYRLFQPTEKWVQIYADVTVQSFEDEEV